MVIHHGGLTFHFEKLILIDDDEDEMKAKSPMEKNTAASGRKPKLSKSSPLFQHIWKYVSKELKRTFFFIDPFPNSEDYELLPMEVYKKAISSVGGLGCYNKDEVRSQARKAYNFEWGSSVSQQSTPCANNDK